MQDLFTPFILVKISHYLRIFLVVAAVFGELLLFKPVLSRAEIKCLSVVDAAYGLGAIIVASAGLTLWLSDIGKPAEFYNRYAYIYVKLIIFSIVGILSIYPTVWFIKQRKGPADERVAVPSLLRTFLIIEALLLLSMPVWAVLMVYS